MDTIVCHIPLIPLRKEPDHRSEQVSQLLFGETAEVIDSKDEWSLVKISFDGYEGWIEQEACIEVGSVFSPIQKKIITEPIQRISNKDGEMLIPAGAEILMPDRMGCFSIGEKKWCIPNYKNSDTRKKEGSISATARKFLNAPYLWGGRTVFGIDCSGFTQVVYKIHHSSLPRDAKDQSKKGQAINHLVEARADDLLFFSNSNGEITHTGILLEKNLIIHASKWVRIDRVDENGIFNVELNKYTHLLSCIRRYKKKGN